MGLILPPYLNKNIKKYEAQLAKAEKQEKRAKEKYEEAKEFTALCRKALEDVK